MSLLIGCASSGEIASPEIIGTPSDTAGSETLDYGGHEGELTSCSDFLGTDSEGHRHVVDEAIRECEERYPGGIPADEIDGAAGNLDEWIEGVHEEVVARLEPAPPSLQTVVVSPALPDGRAWYTEPGAVKNQLGENLEGVCAYLDEQIEQATADLTQAYEELDDEGRQRVGADWVGLHATALVFRENVGADGDGLPVEFARACHGRETNPWFNVEG